MEMETAKAGKYSGLGAEYDFVPFGVETFGPWGPGALSLFKDLSKRLRDTTGDRRAGSFLAQRISLAIQRGNAAGIFGTMPQDLEQPAVKIDTMKAIAYEFAARGASVANATQRLLQHAHCAPPLCSRDYPTKLTPAHNYPRFYHHETCRAKLDLRPGGFARVVFGYRALFPRELCFVPGLKEAYVTLWPINYLYAKNHVDPSLRFDIRWMAGFNQRCEQVVGPCTRSARIATTILFANPAVKQQCLHCCVSAWRIN
ncbi:hypothetical protein MSG28_000064 [Choristoneura fumiferana]|uniref:Uncharacterized protein n=1 Tax=Choristoneura fumiferana TaxID=7141 RepID=A0ACC0JZ71_CHOFU|nr:hypothetical protein MSG28_000064 [Choristoneura fumiferana]